jgi:hypothetical protein
MTLLCVISSNMTLTHARVIFDEITHKSVMFDEITHASVMFDEITHTRTCWIK